MAPDAGTAAALTAEPMAVYRALCQQGLLQPDPAQQLAIERLQSLYRALFDAGVVVVATSNRPPDELYEHGLQRERFLPFIALLKHKLYVLELDSGRDHRLARLHGKPVYHHPLDEAAHDALENAFAELTDGASGAAATTLIVKGRPLAVPRAARGVAW